MKKLKFATGAFVFTRAQGLEPRDPEDLQPLAQQHGIDSGFIPAYAGDRVAVSRALAHASAGLAREGFLLRPITRTASEVVYGIVREQRDEADQRLEHEFKATVAWTAEPDPTEVRGEHTIAQRVRDAYQAVRGKIVADDWSASIARYLEACDAARVRGDGRVYWVPPQRLEWVRSFGALLAEVGIDLILCEIEAENHTVVQAVAQDGLADQLQALEAEAAAFDGTQRPSTYERRLQEYQRLRERAVLYRDALGVGVERAQAVLTALEQKVTAMLDLRARVVVHRDGTTDEAPLPPVTLQFGGATFRPAGTPQADSTMHMFASGDAAARQAVAALAPLGLAGRWQHAGPAQVRISNSGPVGAEVSIVVKLPAGATLAGTARHLTALGITVA